VSDTKRVWLDPRDCGLVTVEAERKRKEEMERKRAAEVERNRKAELEERKRREQQERKEAMKREEEDKKAKTQVLIAQPKAEILPPAPKVPALPPLEIDAMPLPDLSGIEHQMRQATQMLDLNVPEGWLDKWFGRPDHRIRVKTERAELLAGYVGACAAILVEGRRVIEAAGALQREKYQLVIDRLVALHTLMQAYYKLEFARRQAIRQDAIEDAKARETVADHEAKIREHGLRGRPAPPPPPPLPPPPPEDPRAKKKASLQQNLDRLAKEEKEAIAKITGGKPEGEWTDDMKEEIKRTTNMYFHAKEKVRNDMRQYL
jgi:hypothetical protein